MSRKITQCEKWPENVNPYSSLETRIYEIQLITPIFGGGVEAGVNDPITLIRPSSIRGHLRFFWRATRGTKLSDISRLRQEEGAIWGTTKNPSQVGLRVKIKLPGKTYPCAYFPEDKSFPRFERDHPPYALFPFQGNKRDSIPPSKCTSNISFELSLTYPKNLSNDVNASVWAWVNFGGIGARVRRGCGALYCKELSPDSNSINTWYRTSLERYGINSSSVQDWPTMPDRFLILNNNSKNALLEWSSLIGLMGTFRQGVGVGRNPGSGPNRPGRSRFPESESVRKATSSRSARHSRIPSIPDDAFPRAEIGLPIVFHFQGMGDPKDTELYPMVNGLKKTRMSSPLILRPLICRNGEVMQMILRLNTPSLDEVVLEKANGSPRFKKIRDRGLASYPNSPMGSPKAGLPARSPSGSAIEGFLSFAREKGFIEVI